MVPLDRNTVQTGVFETTGELCCYFFAMNGGDTIELVIEDPIIRLFTADLFPPDTPAIYHNYFDRAVDKVALPIRPRRRGPSIYHSLRITPVLGGIAAVPGAILGTAAGIVLWLVLYR